MESTATRFSVARLVKFDGEGTVKAYCDVTIDDRLLIKGLRVISGKNGLFVSMPRQQGKDQKWYDSVVPLSRDTKTEIERTVLEAYQNETGT